MNMKINPFMTILSLVLAALAAYALYFYCASDDLRWVLTCTGGVSIFLVWAGTLGVSLENPQRNVNFKVLSAVFGLTITALQIIFTFHPVQTPIYLLWTGILLILWLVIAYALAK